MKIVDAGSRVIVKADNDVPFAQSGIPCRAVYLKRHNKDSGLNVKVIVADDTARKRNVLSGQADITATDFTVAKQTAGNELGCINRSGEGDSLGRHNHRRVDANHLSARVNQWPTRIAGIECGISLNHSVHQSARLRAQRTPKRAYHSGRHAVLEAVRIADGHYQLPHPNFLCITQMGRHQIGRIDSDYRQVSVRIVSDQIRLVLAPIRYGYFDSLSAVHHVAICQNEAVGSEDETRSGAPSFLRHSRSVSSPAPDRLLDLYIDNRRADLFCCGNNRSRISVHNVFVRTRVSQRVARSPYVLRLKPFVAE